jgi:uncharacterized RDD family membrane protein YckC
MESAREYPNATGKRIAAALIDVAVLAIIFGVMAWLFGDHETVRTTTTGPGVNRHNTTAQLNLTGLASLVYLGIVVVYYFGFEAALKATPGKLALGLRVVSLNAEPLSLGRMALRNVLRIVDGLPFLYLVGLAVIAGSKHHQRVGDMAAATTVSYPSRDGINATAPIEMP